MNHQMPEELYNKRSNKQPHIQSKKWMKDNMKKPKQMKNQLYDRHLSKKVVQEGNLLGMVINKI